MSQRSLLLLLCITVITFCTPADSQSSIDIAYIPLDIKKAIQTLKSNYPDLDSHIDISLFTDDTVHLASLELLQQRTQQLIDIITNLEPSHTILGSLQLYLQALESKSTDIIVNKDLIAATSRLIPIVTTGTGSAFLSAATAFNILGGSNMNTSGSGSTVTVNLNNSPSVSGCFTAGTGITATAGDITATAGNLHAPAGSLTAGTTVTAGTGLTVTSGGITSTGTTTLNSLSAGMMNTNSSGVVASTSTTNNAVQVGNSSGTLSSVGVGTNGQVLLGATSGAPAFASLTSAGGTIALTAGANSLNLDTTGIIADAFPTDSGTATPSSGALTVHGGSNMNTSGSGSTVTVNLNNSPSVSGSLTAGTSVSAGTMVTAGTGITATTGDIIATAGNLHATSGSLTAGTTVTAGTGLTATTGGLTVSAGGITSTGTTTLNSLGAGLMNTNSSGVVASTSTTDHAVQVGNSSGTLSSIGVGTNGQVLLGSTNANPAFASLTSNNGNIIFSAGSNSLAIDTASAVADAFPTDSGTATPSSGALTVHGGSNMNTSGSGSTVTVNLNNSPSVSGSLTTGTSVSAGTTVTAGTGLTATTGGLTVSAGGITSTGTTTFKSLGTGIVNTNSSGVVASTSTTNNAVQLGNASGTLSSLGVGTNGQVLLGATSAAPAFASLTSTGGTLTLTTGANSLNLDTAGKVSTSFPTGSGTATPSSGVLTIAGGSNMNTSGSGSTVTVNLNNSPSVSGSLTAGTTVTAGTGITATTGGLTVSAGGITATGITTLNSLGAGMMNTNGSGVVASTGTTNHAVQIGNSSGTLSSLGVGTNGQVLLGSTSANPAFATVSSPDSSILFGTGPKSLTLQVKHLCGNVCHVDGVNGNDNTAAINGLPFATIGAALAVATSGTTIFIMPGIYALTSPLGTIPNGVCVIGLSQGAGSVGGVQITYTATSSSNGTLCTMGENSRLENVSLQLTTSTQNMTLTAIQLPGTTSVTARIEKVTISVTNTATNGSSVNSNAYGIYSNSTGVPTPEVSAVRNCVINVSTGKGLAVGIYAFNGGSLNVTDTHVTVTHSGSNVSDLAYGINIVNSPTNCTLNNCTIGGINNAAAAQGADIYPQSSGSLTLNNTRLVNANSNGTFFNSAISPSILTWTGTGTLTKNVTRYMYPGTIAASSLSTTESFTQITAPKACIIKGLQVTAGTAPSSGSTVVTLRVAGISTALTATLSSTATTASDLSHAITVSSGQLISMQVVTSGSSNTTANMLVTAEIY